MLLKISNKKCLKDLWWPFIFNVNIMVKTNKWQIKPIPSLLFQVDEVDDWYIFEVDNYLAIQELKEANKKYWWCWEILSYSNIEYEEYLQQRWKTTS